MIFSRGERKRKEGRKRKGKEGEGEMGVSFFVD
jgi:hypothetical protein